MIKEKAYAKINLFLNVVAKRFDGYHDLEMIMAALELHDLLTFLPKSDSSISVTSTVPIVEKQEDNIVYQIAMYVQEEFQITTGVEIHIAKNIPIAAGLAGGSADAAATLRGLNKLWKLKLSLEDMARIGATFGADIPFCVYNKLCIAKGKGEELVFLNTKLKLPVILVNPNIKISTKEVFSRVKPEIITEHKITDMTNAIYNKNYALITRELHNSLEQIVFEILPAVQEIKKQIRDGGVAGVLMSGSGATVYGICRDKKKMKHVYDIIPDSYYKLITKIR